MNDLLLTFYGDDFTGSTDVMEALVLGGVPAVLFLEPPSADFVAEHFPHVRALGVAGVSRSMSPAQMEAELPPIFNALQSLNAPLFHYKICSTFDSSPEVGSIGHAIELGLRIFEAERVPLIVGAPVLKRYVAFGNLFATFGDDTYRIDRHPTMKQHPITPMDEGDLRLHLGRQTDLRIGLIDMRHMADPDSLEQRYRQLLDEGCIIILFDTLNDDHLLTIGEQVWSMRGNKPVLVVGSSGVEYALTAHWQRSGFIQAPPPRQPAGSVDKLAVISGSAAPQTAIQIQWAIDHGFHPIRLDSAGLIDPDCVDSARYDALSQALNALDGNRNVILFSTIGPDDPAISTTKQRMTQLGYSPNEVGARLGSQQGLLLRELLEHSGLRRACVSGGDTCGYAARQLGIYALEYVMPVAPGSPLCRAQSHNPAFDRLEISLKAGQVGKADYFGSILRGHV
jgi:3-oxoisoapionate kinase